MLIFATMLQMGVYRMLLVLLLSNPFFSWAQECSFELKGLIEDTQGEALVGATVWLENLQLGTTSDLDGRFLIKNLCAGQYAIVIKYVGYEDQRLTVKVPALRSNIIRLKPSVRVLHDIVIEGDHSQRHALSQSLSILTEEQLVSSRGKSLGEMLQTIPGVTNVMSGPAVFKPVINGLHSQRILILNNGIRQEGQQWGIDHAPEIDPFIASELEVVKGAEAVRYGAEAMGGVIIINTPDLHYSTSLGGELHMGYASNNRMGVVSGMLEGALKRNTAIGWRIQGTLKRGGDYHAPDYTLSNTAVAEKNFSVTWGLKKEAYDFEFFLSSFNTEIGILRTSHSGNLTDLQNSIQSSRPWYIRNFTYDINNPRQKISHHLLKLKFRKDLENLGGLNVVYGGQYNDRKEFDIRRDKQDIPSLALNLISHSLDASLDYTKNFWSGSIGINAIGKQNTNETGIGLLPNFNQFTGGLFTFNKYRIKKWLIEGGIRFDHQFLQPRMYYNGELLKPTFNFNYLSGTLGSAVYLNDHARISSIFGITTRPPSVNELYSQGLHHGTASIEEGLMVSNGEIQTDQNRIQNERSFKWVNTYHYLTKKFSFEITGFANYLSNYIYLTPYDTRLTIRGFFPVFQYRQVDALLAGGDFSIDLNLSENWGYGAKASFVYARDQNTGNKLPFIPPVDFENNITYTIAKAGKWKNVQAKVISNFVSTQTRAPQTILPEDISSFEGSQTFDFMAPPGSYLLWGVNLSGNLPLGNREFTLSLSGENLANTSYRNYMNRLRYYADETGRNVTLRIIYKFHAHH
jgi:iron complex outermembrane recepter protein